MSDLAEILERSGTVTFDQDQISQTVFYHAQLSPNADMELKELVYIEFLEAICKAASLGISRSKRHDPPSAI